MKEYRASQYAAFDVPTLANQIFRTVLVADAFDVLLDDGAFVEIRRHVMRGGADQFYAACVSLMVGLRTLEAGQKTVMDVDAATGKEPGEIVRQDLHVTGEHDQVGVGLRDDSLDLRFLLRLGFPRNRQIVEGYRAKVSAVIGLARMIGDDADDIHPELASAPAIEQIDQAMVEFRHQQQHLATLIPRPDLPNHPIMVADRLEAGDNLRNLPIILEIEDNAGEEASGFGIVELMRLKDVAAMREQLGTYAGDDTRPVRAGQRQKIRGIGHQNLMARDGGRSRSPEVALSH